MRHVDSSHSVKHRRNESLVECFKYNRTDNVDAKCITGKRNKKNIQIFARLVLKSGSKRNSMIAAETSIEKYLIQENSIARKEEF